MEGVPPPFPPFPPAGMLGQRPGMLVHSSWGLGRPPFSRMPQPFVRFAGGGPPPPGTRPPFQPRQQVRPQPPRPVVDERAPARY